MDKFTEIEKLKKLGRREAYAEMRQAIKLRLSVVKAEIASLRKLMRETGRDAVRIGYDRRAKVQQFVDLATRLQGYLSQRSVLQDLLLLEIDGKEA